MERSRRIRATALGFASMACLVATMRLLPSGTTLSFVSASATGFAGLVVAGVVCTARLGPLAEESTVFLILCVFAALASYAVLEVADDNYLRGKVFIGSLILVKALALEVGIRWAMIAVFLTWSLLHDIISLRLQSVAFGVEPDFQQHLALIILWLGFQACCWVRRTEMVSMFNAECSVAAERQAVEALQAVSSDALLWVEADGDTIARHDSRLDAHLARPPRQGARERAPQLSDYVAREARAELSEAFDIRRKSLGRAQAWDVPVDIFRTTFQHDSGVLIKATLTVVDRRSEVAGGDGPNGQQAEGFLVGVQLTEPVRNSRHPSEPRERQQRPGERVLTFESCNSFLVSNASEDGDSSLANRTNRSLMDGAWRPAQPPPLLAAHHGEGRMPSCSNSSTESILLPSQMHEYPFQRKLERRSTARVDAGVQTEEATEAEPVQPLRSWLSKGTGSALKRGLRRHLRRPTMVIPKSVEPEGNKNRFVDGHWVIEAGSQEVSGWLRHLHIDGSQAVDGEGRLRELTQDACGLPCLAGGSLSLDGAGLVRVGKSGKAVRFVRMKQAEDCLPPTQEEEPDDLERDASFCSGSAAGQLQELAQELNAAFRAGSGRRREPGPKEEGHDEFMDGAAVEPRRPASPSTPGDCREVCVVPRLF